MQPLSWPKIAPALTSRGLVVLSLIRSETSSIVDYHAKAKPTLLPAKVFPLESQPPPAAYAVADVVLLLGVVVSSPPHAVVVSSPPLFSSQLGAVELVALSPRIS